MNHNSSDNIINTILNENHEVYDPSGKSFYSIEEASQIVNITRRTIAIYYKYGLISPHIDPENEIWMFDEEAILRLKRIERLRSAYNLNFQALKIIMELMSEVERLRKELRKLQMR